jgi:hypothetical protein
MEDFVNFEIAKKLKEKGFKEKVNAYYGMLENLFDVHPALDMNDSGYRASAPTISQVLKWLREEKKIHIEIGFGCYGFCWDLTLNIKYVEGYNNSEWDLLDWEKYADIDNQANHSTYEECALCAIEYVLYNLI